MEEKSRYEIEALPEDDEKPAAESASSEAPALISASEAENNAGSSGQEAGDNAPQSASPANGSAGTFNENTVTVPANFEKKNYMKEIVVAAVMTVLCALGAVLGALVVAYRYVGIIIAALGALAALAMVRHIFLSEKVLKAIAGEEKVYIEELMKKTGKKKKPEFVRELATLIKEGHLTGYSIVNDIFLQKTEK